VNRREKTALASVVSLAALTLLGVAAGLLLNRLISFDDALDAGGEWDEGGGVHTVWPLRL
jgi:hypothetical protein